MAETNQGAMKELSEGIRAILQRIGDFFDIFDLSFIISGAVSLAGIGVFIWRAKVALPEFQAGWPLYILLVFCSYILGLACFILGRWLRLTWRWLRFGDPTDRLSLYWKGTV